MSFGTILWAAIDRVKKTWQPRKRSSMVQCLLETVSTQTSVLLCFCQVRVYSGKGSGQVWMKTDEGRGQRFGQRLARAGVATNWIQ